MNLTARSKVKGQTVLLSSSSVIVSIFEPHSNSRVPMANNQVLLCAHQLMINEEKRFLFEKQKTFCTIQSIQLKFNSKLNRFKSSNSLIDEK